MNLEKHDFIFRRASVLDEVEIYGLYRSLIGTEGCAWDEDYPALEDVKGDICAESLYCLCDGERIIAAATITEDCRDLEHLGWRLSVKNPCELSRVGVAKEYQGRGIGTLMLKYMEHVAKEKGFDEIRLIASQKNPAALRLYERNGYSQCGEAKLYGLDWFCYEKQFE